MLPAAGALGDVSDDDDDDEFGGAGMEAMMHKYDESQRQLFAGLAQQQVKIHKHLHKAITDLDERVQVCAAVCMFLLCIWVCFALLKLLCA